MDILNADDAPHTLRLLIADDQALIRRGLSMMLASEAGIAVVGEAADGAQAVEIAVAKRPDVVLMDLQMPHTGGVAATREITARLPATRVVVLTTFDDDERVFEAIRAGAHAYLLKDASVSELLETIRGVQRGESRLSPSIARKVIEQLRGLPAPPVGAAPAAAGPPHAPRDDALTEKEARVLDLIALGKSNKQIAAAVFLAEGTVKNYVSRIMDKLHAHSRTELALRALGRGG